MEDKTLSPSNSQNPNISKEEKEANKKEITKTEMCQLIYYDFSLK